MKRPSPAIQYLIDAEPESNIIFREGRLRLLKFVVGKFPDPKVNATIHETIRRIKLSLINDKTE